MIEFLAGAATVILIASLYRWVRDRSPETIRPVETVQKQAEQGEAALGEKAAEIFMRMSEGVLVVDENLRPNFVNPSARHLLGLRPGRMPNRIPAVEVADLAQLAITGEGPVDEVTEIYYPAKTALRVHAVALPSRSEVLIVLQDVSEQLRTQRARREFVAHASHELKSPVAGLQVLAEALADALQSEDRDNARRFSGRILTELHRLSKLVEDLLDLSRLEGPERPPTDPCDLVGIAGREASALRTSATEAGLSLEVDLADELWVAGDLSQLGLLVRNLVQNAIQYTPPGGSIRLSVRAHDGQALLSVTDDGIGIPLESQARIFERFYRVDRARSRDRGGTGLGLAIVKHVAESHNGTVTVTSELGSGSTFTVRFPLHQAVDREPSQDNDEKESA